jgi:Flp pilus assembly protein TadD
MPGMAIPRFQQAIDTSPKVPLYHYHLGVTYAQAGEDSKARRALERALQLDSAVRRRRRRAVASLGPWSTDHAALQPRVVAACVSRV